MTSNVAREKWGLEVRPGGWVESEKDLWGNTQDMTIADPEHGFPLGADDVVFPSTSKYWQMRFVLKGRNHPLKTELSFLEFLVQLPKDLSSVQSSRGPRGRGVYKAKPRSLPGHHRRKWALWSPIQEFLRVCLWFSC